MKLTTSYLRKLIKESVRHLRENVLTADLSSWNGQIIGATTPAGEELSVGEMVADLLPKGKLPKGSNIEALSSPNPAAGDMSSWDADVFSDYYGVDLQQLLVNFAEEYGLQLEMPSDDPVGEEEYDPSRYF
tara:strand:+ start:359 stop:751 length:393 start_codon:yes stop_codon:yes gene_type:complete